MMSGLGPAFDFIRNMTRLKPSLHSRTGDRADFRDRLEAFTLAIPEFG